MWVLKLGGRKESIVAALFIVVNPVPRPNDISRVFKLLSIFSFSHFIHWLVQTHSCFHIKLTVSCLPLIEYGV